MDKILFNNQSAMAEITLNSLVVTLFDALKKKKISVPKFSDEADIPKDRIYKWKQQGTSPKAEDVIKVNKWLKKNGVDINPQDENLLNEPEINYPRKNEFLPLYIDSLKEQKKILEVQNDFLRRNFETSLNTIAENQYAANSQLRALSWYNALVASGGNEKKAEAEVVKMNNKAAWYAGFVKEGNIGFDAGKKNTARKQ
jgi:hypothetical protein